MATRVKKQPATTTTTTKEIIVAPQTSKNEVIGTTATTITSHDVVASKKGRKPGIRKTVAFKAKTKVVRKRNMKINPKSLARVLMENGKALTDKQIRLKNGTKEGIKRTRKPKLTKIKREPPEEEEEEKSSAPVLEPIFPQEENLEVKKRKRGRPFKTTTLIEIKKEPVDDLVESTSEAVPVVVKKKAGRPKKRVEPSMDEVMTDLSFLIDPGQIKKEVVDSTTSEPSPKPKKLTRKQRLDIIKTDLTKKENLENTLNKIDAADAKLIDRLDLNVRKFKTNLPRIKRRHSIEKFSMTDSSDSITHLSVFNQLPRSLSPRTSKRASKLIKPYTTRSDSPARMLRNGKHRRLKDFVLLEGLEGPKRRKRVHSDLSGSETTSKLSGYESDSSYSDFASLHDSEKDANKDLDSLLLDESTNLDLKNATAQEPQIDTNSNVCSSKMPEKNLLLDIMKQTFNDMSSDKLPTEKPCTSSEPALTEEEELRQLLEQSEHLEEKQAAEQIQECIDNITNLAKAASEEAPVLEKQVQDAEPQQNHEHLGPPLLESSITVPEQKRSFIDENLGIAVVEKDNVVSFHIEHLSGDDVDELDTSNEDLNQSLEEKMEVEAEEKMEVEAEEKVAEVVENEEAVTESKEDVGEVEESADEVDRAVVEAEESVVEPESAIVEPKCAVDEPECAVEESVVEPEIAVEEPKCAVEETVVEPKCEVEEPKKDEATKQLELEEEIVKQVDGPQEEEVVKAEEIDEKMEDEATSETKEILTDEKKDCDKTSETIENKEAEPADKNPEETPPSKESPEELAEKESILGALGLQSLRAAKDTPPQLRKKGKASTSKAAADAYTGTLKTVIKINKKRGKNSFKMTLQKNKNKSEKAEAAGSAGEEGYKVLKESGSSSCKTGKDSSDTAGAHRKSHYSNRSNMENSSEHTSDSEQANHDKSQPEKSLIVPEKASSFSIHPGRLCKDECSYCFGKFGLFDTPCHIAQIKSVDRQNKILATEQHLTRDSCLCDACYRHVDRKSNSPSYINKSLKRNSLVAPGPRQNHCHVLGCSNMSTNILRRKWIIKMRKSICQVINIDLDNPGLHSIPICDEHYGALEHLMICGMCKRRLARNHIHYLGPEVKELNDALKDEGLPIFLCDKPVVCKLCKCFASIILKDPEERMENSVNFFKEYKKRLLHFNDIVPMDVVEAEEPMLAPAKPEKPADKKDSDRIKRMRNSSNESGNSEIQDEELEDVDVEERPRKRVPSSDTNHSQSANQSRAQSPEDEYAGVDYNTLIPAIAMDCSSDNESKKDNCPKIVQKKQMPKLETFGGAIEISRSYKKDNDLAAQKLGQNPSISLRPNYGEAASWQEEPSPGKVISNTSLSVRQLFPGEEEMGLVGDIDFKNVTARTPEGWEKCVATIQYDEDTKMLWQELQKPYGSKSSFLRHLVLLEKYFRNGDLVLSQSASHHAVNYKESVHNRLRAYDNIPSNIGQIQPPSMVQFNKIYSRNTSGQSNSNGLPPVTISQVGRVDNEIQSSRTPITLQQLNQPPLYPTSTILQNLAKNKAGVAPPGLISINQKPTAPSTIVRPQMPSQKIKFPITKNWRPNLIPIDPSKKNERKPGLVQVISGGKPYHITLEDYKKMCAIKRSFEAKQKKVQEQQLARQQSLLSQNSILKSSQHLKKPISINKTSGGTLIENKITLVPSATITSDSSESILEKLDKQVERLGQRNQDASIRLENNPAIQIIPRIPKSLTVIPQTVRKGPPSPVLLITKTSSNGGGSSSSEDRDSQP